MSTSVGGGFEWSVDTEPYITYELRADSPERALDVAAATLDANQRSAGLPSRTAEVEWCAPMSADVSNSHRFLKQAKDLAESDEYDLAVVAAQIHFELQLRLLLERAANRLGTAWAKRLAKSRAVSSLRTDEAAATVELLLDLDVRVNPNWPAFTRHLKRRNDVVHEGAFVSREDALESIEVVQRLWAKLAEAEFRKTLF